MLRSTLRHPWLVAALSLTLLAACAAPQKTGKPAAPPTKAALASQPTAAELPARLHSILNRLEKTGATYTSRIVLWPQGREIFAHDCDAPYTPASNMKILTSTTALDLLGADCTLKTYLARDGDDLWLIGGGDPALGDPRLAKKYNHHITAVFDDWAQVLVQRGIKEISGNLYYDDAILDAEHVHKTWGESTLHWYGAPIAGLAFNDNCVDITVRPTEYGHPADFSIVPPLPSLKVINECVSRPRHDPTLVKLPGENTYKLTGTCAKEEELKSKPVEDAGRFTAEVLRMQLAAQGITIAGEIRHAPQPLGGKYPPPANKLIATAETPLREVLGRVNTNSNNMMADTLCKLAGRAFAARQGRDVPGSWADGGLAIHAFLKAGGIDDRAVVVADGSGLSDENKVTARVLTELFARMKSRPDADLFVDSLAKGGINGTLEKRYAGYENHVFAKTGQIDGVRALSGYAKAKCGQWVIFSIIYNHIPGEVEPYEALQDEAVKLLIDRPWNEDGK